MLAVELKAGTADLRVFGQISTYLGLLKGRYPDKKIKGVIIAGNIGDDLRSACLVTNLITLKTYKMSLLLEAA